MARQGLFSERNEVGRPASGLVREDIPNGIRNFVRTFLEDVAGYGFGNILWRRVVVLLDLSPELYHQSPHTNDTGNTAELDKYLRVCPYGRFLDICEIMYTSLSERSDSKAESFHSLLNIRFMRYYSTYQMDDEGKVFEPGSQAGEQVIEQARALLRGPDFEGPDRQFQGALLDFHSASSPNYEGTVADALNAVEGVARIVLRDSSIKLGQAASRIRDEKGLHPRLANSITSLHDYASDKGGRHGLTGAPDADRMIAEFCLHQAAASIVFLARLYGHEVVQGS